MTVKDITDCLGPYANVIIHDRKDPKGSVYEGTVIDMRTFWDKREVVWLKVFNHELVIEVE